MQTSVGARGNSRVLVIFPGALGDLICAGPALDAIANANPCASIELMAKPELARLFAGRTRVARGHSIDRREVAALFTAGEISRETHEFFSQFTRLYSYLAHDDPQFRTSLDQCSPGRTIFLPFRPPGSGHVAAAYLAMIAGTSNDHSFQLRLKTDDMESAASALKSVGIEPDSRFVAIFPGSGSKTKNWPVANFIALARSIPADARPLFILGPAETDIEAQLSALDFPVLKNLELSTVAGVARRAAAFIGNDSGTSHLATAVGTAGIALFGPTSPERWRPLGRVTIVAQPALDRITVADVTQSLARVVRP